MGNLYILGFAWFAPSLIVNNELRKKVRPYCRSAYLM